VFLQFWLLFSATAVCCFLGSGGAGSKGPGFLAVF